MRRLLFLVALVALSGCSTSPITDGEAKSIPAERIYAPDLVGNSSGKLARVAFLRDTGFVGSGCSHDVYVNNRKAFSIRQGEGVQLELLPGPYFFRLETGGGLCPNIATSQDIELKEGMRVAYRILLPSDGSLRLTRVR